MKGNVSDLRNNGRIITIFNPKLYISNQIKKVTKEKGLPKKKGKR